MSFFPLEILQSTSNEKFQRVCNTRQTQYLVLCGMRRKEISFIIQVLLCYAVQKLCSRHSLALFSVCIVLCCALLNIGSSVNVIEKIPAPFRSYIWPYITYLQWKGRPALPLLSLLPPPNHSAVCQLQCICILLSWFSLLNRKKTMNVIAKLVFC